MNVYDTPAGYRQQESHRLNLRDIQRDNYYGNTSMPLGMTLTHRLTGIQVKGTGRPDNNRRDTGWKLFEELLGIMERVVAQAEYDKEDPEGVVARAKIDVEIMRKEVEGRLIAIGKNPNDLIAIQEKKDADIRIEALEALVASLTKKMADDEASKKDARIAELEAKLFAATATAAPATLHAKK